MTTEDSDLGASPPSAAAIKRLAARRAGPRPERAGGVARAAAREEQERQDALRASGKRVDPNKLTRVRRRVDDRFYVDPKIVPAGQSYQWVAEKTTGMSMEEHVNGYLENHWTPVPEDRHTGVVVEKDGMRLYERPKYLTDEARREDFEIAMGEVTAASAGLRETPDGTFTRDHPNARAATKINVQYGPGHMDVPQD